MAPQKNYRHLFFDLDNTVTRSRSKITPEMKDLMASLFQDLVVISGAAVPQIERQLDGLPAYCLGQNGNHAVHGSRELWLDALSETEVEEIKAHIASLPRDWKVPDESDLIENRGCQLSYSIYGHHAPVEEKEAFDPDCKKRRSLLAASPLHSNTIEVRIAGTTTLDYFKRGKHKGYNIQQLIAHEDWNKDECLYFGDALFPGGNDETVIGTIETVSVANPKETYEHLQQFVA